VEKNSTNIDIFTEHTQAWVENVVIDLNLCPFAQPSWGLGFWDISTLKGNDHMELIKGSIAMIEDTVKKMLNGSLENQLIVMPECLDEFLPFLNLCSIIEIELEHSGALDSVQMVVFHPQFRFEGESVDDRGNYVNRSPYPTIHILKKEAIDKALSRLNDNIGEVVSFKNKETLNGLSERDFKEKVLSYLEVAQRPLKD